MPGRNSKLIAALFCLLFGGGCQAQVAGGTAPPNFYACPQTVSSTEYITSTAGLTAKDSALTANTAVIIAIGQSIVGNHSQGLHAVTQDVRMINICGDGNVYLHAEPMVGTTWTANGYQGFNSGYGSYLGDLGDLLISGGKYDRVYFCNASYAGMAVSNFIPGGQLGFRLSLCFNTLRKLGIPASRVTTIIHNAGESDGIAGIAQATYQAQVQQMMSVARGYGFTGKWIIPLESRAYGCNNATIRAAETALADGVNGVQGPDFDALTEPTNRYQESASAGCATNAYVHFNATGRAAAASAMKATIYANF